MARLRVGPLSYGPKGRRGLHAGPFGFSYNTRNPVLGAFVLLAIIIAVVQAFWPYLLAAGVIIVVARIATQGGRANAAEAAKQRREEALQRWLTGPPPPLALPARFSHGWWASNLPGMHPGQVPILLAEMRARGWTNERIQQRVGPYLRQNPYYGRPSTASAGRGRAATPRSGAQRGSGGSQAAATPPPGHRASNAPSDKRTPTDGTHTAGASGDTRTPPPTARPFSASSGERRPAPDAHGSSPSASAHDASHRYSLDSEPVSIEEMLRRIDASMRGNP